jgi:hypothetical protein
MDMVYKPIIKKWIWFTIGFFLLDWCDFLIKWIWLLKLDLVWLVVWLWLTLFFAHPYMAGPIYRCI